MIRRQYFRSFWLRSRVGVMVEKPTKQPAGHCVRLGFGVDSGEATVPNANESALRETLEVLVLIGGRYWARTSDLCRVKQR